MVIIIFLVVFIIWLLYITLFTEIHLNYGDGYHFHWFDLSKDNRKDKWGL